MFVVVRFSILLILMAVCGVFGQGIRVPKRGVPKTFAFALILRLCSETWRSKALVLRRPEMEALEEVAI